MKSLALNSLWFLCVLCASVVNGFTLDREAFSFTNYDLHLEVDPGQHRLGVRGKVTLRNDRPTPEQVAILQISSSLRWHALGSLGKPVQFVTQPLASDIDHTGGLSEAIVTLPQPVAPHATVDLDIAYEGVIEVDATRLTRIGTPEDLAKNSDWDVISPSLTVVRGAGYVAWYPIAAEVANLSEGDLFAVLARWKQREAGSQMRFGLHDPNHDNDADQGVMVCSGEGLNAVTLEGKAKFPTAQCIIRDVAHSAPTFALAHYGMVERPSIVVNNLPTHAVAAEAYAGAGQTMVPFITNWFGAPREKVQIADLDNPDYAPFESGPLLLTSLVSSDPVRAGLAVAHQLTHAAFSSPRPWIDEGLAHFAQALYLEHEKGRQAALDYMAAHRSALSQVEGSPGSEDGASDSLVNTVNEELYRSKAMCVWWMLRDMIGDPALKKALAFYKPEQDSDPSYMPRLIGAQTQRDLQWFFDDWVYHDRGLPDFNLESAFSQKRPNNSYLLTVTVENLGTAGAEVPVIVKFATGEVTKRLELRAKNQATIRIETPEAAREVIVNDGSVPESSAAGHTYKVAPPKDQLP